MSMAAVICLIAAVAVLAGSVAHGQPREHVSVAVTTASVREGNQTRSDTLLLWNRNERSRPIGHAVQACVKAGQGGLLGGGLMSCSLILSLPLGKVAAVGIVHNLRRYTLTITGGTGAYETARGALFMRSVSGDGVRRLTFAL